MEMNHFIDFSGKIENRAQLPHYPTPEPREVLERMVRWVEPLVTEEQRETMSEKVEQFCTMPQFEKISKKMRELGTRENDSWIFDYWVRSHLEVRDPICPYTSVPIRYENPIMQSHTVAEKAAAVLTAVSGIYLQFRQEGNGAYQVGHKVYSNDEFFGTLASINHIRRGMDQMYISSEIARYALVLYGNHIYMLETLAPDLTPIPYSAILGAVEQILQSKAAPLIPAFNFVTAEPDRDLGGDYLAELLQIPENKKEYQQVKDAILAVNLDENCPIGTVNELYGTCYDPVLFNRFHGKGTQFSIAGNGVMSMIVDHTFCDGGIETYLATQLANRMEQFEFTMPSAPTEFRELHFTIPEPLKETLCTCLSRYRQRMNAYVAEVVEFPQLTREILQSKGILSGDGFIHIALQAAQYMTWGEIRNTYISVDCRSFFRGRTEVNRPVTPESVRFVHLLLDAKVGQDAKKECLLQALDAHHHRTQEAQAGQGVNRYLYVLNQVCLDYGPELGLTEQPALFSDPAVAIMKEDRLSTTSFGHSDMKCSYFPPVMPKGIGVFYKVGVKSFLINTMFCEDAAVLTRFNTNLKSAVAQMLQL